MTPKCDYAIWARPLICSPIMTFPKLKGCFFPSHIFHRCICHWLQYGQYLSISQVFFLLYCNWVSWPRGRDLVTAGRWINKQILILAASFGYRDKYDRNGCFWPLSWKEEPVPTTLLTSDKIVLIWDSWQKFCKVRTKFQQLWSFAGMTNFPCKSRLWLQNLSIEITNPDNLNRFMEFKQKTHFENLCPHTTKYVLVLQ